MRTPTIRATGFALTFASTASIAGIAILAGLAAAEEQGLGRGQAPALLQGTWNVRITPYDCGSDPIVSYPQFTVASLFTFGAGGTLVETNSNPRFAPGQRSPGHGIWERTGRNKYVATFEAFIQFDGTPPSPYVRGAQQVDQLIELTDADNWTSTAIVTFRDEAGNQVPPSGCATAVAARMR